LIACAILYVKIVKAQDGSAVMTRIHQSANAEAKQKEAHDAGRMHGVDCSWGPIEDCWKFTHRIERNPALRKVIADAKGQEVLIVLETPPEFIIGKRNRTNPGIIWIDPTQTDQQIINYLNGR
jgi:hypothetical protein